MKQQMLKERMELLAIGEAMSWPRMGYGRTPEGGKLAIKAGKSGWEKFVAKPARAGTPGLLTALRIARTLHDYGIKPYDPRAVVAVTPVVETPKAETPVVDLVGDDLLAAFDRVAPSLSIRQQSGEEMVKPKRSSAAIRQARWRANKKKL
jgi:hypothetical protein